MAPAMAEDPPVASVDFAHHSPLFLSSSCSQYQQGQQTSIRSPSSMARPSIFTRSKQKQHITKLSGHTAPRCCCPQQTLNGIMCLPVCSTSPAPSLCASQTKKAGSSRSDLLHPACGSQTNETLACGVLVQEQHLTCTLFQYLSNRAEPQSRLGQTY